MKFRGKGACNGRHTKSWCFFEVPHKQENYNSPPLPLADSPSYHAFDLLNSTFRADKMSNSSIFTLVAAGAILTKYTVNKIN